MRGIRTTILTAALALGLAACGSSSPASTPLGSALSYFPKGSPFVMSVVTDPNASAVKSGQAMTARIPFAAFGQAAAISRLQQLGINYDADIRPLFGNPLLVSVQARTGGAGRTAVLFAWVTKDSGTLASLIKKLHLPKAGTRDGATIYQVAPITLAVDGATLVAGSSPESVNAALDRHAGGHGMSSADFNRELGNLPKSALIEAAGSLSGVLSASPGATKARSIPWVGALRGYGVAVSAGSAGLTFRYTLDTSAARLSSAQLPIAPGNSPPGLAGSMPIQFGLRQPATTVAFALDAERRTSPAKYAADLAQMRAVSRRTGVSFQRDVLGQMGSNAAVESDGHRFIVRVDVVNPAAAARTLRKLGTSALDIFGYHAGARVSPGPPGFETVHRAKGPNLLFGLVGSEFVAGTAEPAELRAFASAQAVAAPGAQGAAAFRIALSQLLRLTLHRVPSKTIQQVLSSLGDITGWTSSSPGALNGSATLGVK